MSTEREEFKDWLAKELAKRDMRPFHLTKKMNALGHETHASTILAALAGDKMPRPETLRAMAQALEIPEHVIMLAAGVLTEPPPGMENDPIRASIAREVRNEQDPVVLAKILEMVRIARALGSLRTG